MREAREAAAAARAAAKEEKARAEAAAHRKAQQDATDAEIERFRKAAEAQHVTPHSSDATAKHASHLLTLRQEYAHALLAPLGYAASAPQLATTLPVGGALELKTLVH